MSIQIENKPPSNKSPLDYSVLIQTDSFQQQNHLNNNNKSHTIKEVEAKKIFHNIFFLIIYRLTLSTACHLSDSVLFLATYNVYIKCASVGLQILFAFNIAIGFIRQIQNTMPADITKRITSSSPEGESLLEKSSNLYKNNTENASNTQKSTSLPAATNIQSQTGNSSIVPSLLTLKPMVPFDYSSDTFQKDLINSKFKKTIKPSSKFLYQMNSLGQN